MDTIGLVQLDSVNVCVRAHYMPFYSRLGGYDRRGLDRWLNDSGEHFEYWAHEAAVLPVERYPLWRWKMAEMPPWRRAQALLDAHPEIIDDVSGQVRDHGPLTVRDLDAPSQRNEPWWGYGPSKVALEVLFARGDLAALRTGNFMRLYDIPDRMIPPEHLQADPVPREEAHIKLLGAAVSHHGIGTVTDIADYHRLHVPTARPLLAAMAEGGQIEEVAVPGWRGPVYMDPEAKRPRAIQGATLLSPFDPLVWNRQRAERLFGFRYRIEIYVPKEKREYGYYVLPFLLDGELVGRLDLKASRDDGTLLVQSAHVEADRDPVRVASAMASELAMFARWLELGDIEVRHGGNLWRAVGDAL